MKTYIVALMAFAMVGRSGLLASAGEQTYFVGEDQDGHVIMVPASLSELDHSGTCAVEPACTTGDHVHNGIVSHGFLVGGGYTGPAASILVTLPTNGSPTLRVFACNFQAGVPTCQGGQGTFPAVGVTFSHYGVAPLGNPVTGGPTLQISHN
ncbi:MAG: hypothetical protein LC624_09955 [Halobacteriales archaeon]|nr:hypothetical protein [Halobacteriales archaeon]